MERHTAAAEAQSVSWSGITEIMHDVKRLLLSEFRPPARSHREKEEEEIY